MDSIEFHMLHQMLFDKLGDGYFRLEQGCVVVPEAPGIGLGVDAATLAGER